MPVMDEVLNWIETPLEELKKSLTSAPDVAWTDLRATFLQQLGLHDSHDHPVIGALLERLDGMSEDERTDTFSTGRIDTMVRELAGEHAAALDQAANGAGLDSSQSGATADASYDQGAWQEFLLTNGPRWDGSDESWAQFREWFAYHASAASLGTPATQLLDYMDHQSAAERVTTFAQYGVTINVPAQPQSGATADASYNQGAWQEFLLTNGPRWDGSDESWAQFREWFAYHASAASLGTPATQLLDYMDHQSAAERVTTFAQYGVTIPVTAEPASEPAQQAAASQASPDAIMNELIAENKEFESISPERRQQIMDALLSARQSGD